MPDAEPSPGEAFWRFSLTFYALPRVAPALLALQDLEGLDVNLMLFALWLGISGRHPLDSGALAAAERAIGTIRAEVVEPLRSLRRNLKHHADEDIQHLREGIKALELEGEKLVQSRLAHLAGPAFSGIPAEDRLAVAVANLTLYLGPQRLRSVAAMVIRDALGSLMGSAADGF
jgi:uncharacterized protein (TIGR02444 family)